MLGLLLALTLTGCAERSARAELEEATDLHDKGDYEAAIQVVEQLVRERAGTDAAKAAAAFLPRVRLDNARRLKDIAPIVARAEALLVVDDSAATAELVAAARQLVAQTYIDEALALWIDEPWNDPSRATQHDVYQGTWDAFKLLNAARDADPSVLNHAAVDLLREAAILALVDAYERKDQNEESNLFPPVVAECTTPGLSFQLLADLVEVARYGTSSPSCGRGCTVLRRESILEQLKKSGRKRYWGFIIAKMDEDRYEAAFSRSSYWGSVPGEHFLLITEETAFSSGGRFSMWLTEDGTFDGEDVNGFTRTWKIMREDPFGSAVQRALDAPKGEETSKAAGQAIVMMCRAAGVL